MRVTIEKSSPNVDMTAPASKSAMHRLLICAALAEGESVIGNAHTLSADILATIACLRGLGAEITQCDDKLYVKGGADFFDKSVEFPCNECGSTLRFFIPIALLSQKECHFTGSGKLLSRPLGIYEDICKAQNLTMEHKEDGIYTVGRLASGHYDVPGNISSQFITGLLLALPLLREDSDITVTGEFESRPYVDMTMDTLKKYGICIEESEDGRNFFIKGGQKYRPYSCDCEGDWSNAAFLLALRQLHNPSLRVLGADPDSLQGDKVCAEHFVTLKQGFAEIDLSDCPDLAPILFAFAGACHGAHFTGTKRLAYKESDRVAAMKEELGRFGISVEAKENEVTVTPSDKLTAVENAQGHNDHRIVMAVAVLMTLTGGSIDGAEAVNKSFPDFFDTLRKAGVKVEDEA